MSKFKYWNNQCKWYQRQSGELNVKINCNIIFNNNFSCGGEGASVTYYSTVQGNNSVAIARAALAQEILKNRIYGGQAKYSEFNGKTFYSEEDLDEYLLQNHQVTSYLTLSNPNKIIKNYEYMTLDENKIYDTDLNNFKQLYHDAFGNIADTRQTTLDTYTNNSLVKVHYSYDGFYWFDTPEEAKINEKYKMNINKSLYYIY